MSFGSRRMVFIVFALLLIAWFTLPACAPTPAPAPLDLPVSPERDSIGPDFELEDLHGKTARLYDQRGKYMIINFWATWCVPCRKELPILETLQQRHKRDFVVWAISEGDKPEAVREYVEKTNLSLRVLLDTGFTAGRSYQVWAIPTTYILDRQGVVRFRAAGAVSEALFEEAIEMIRRDYP